MSEKRTHHCVDYTSVTAGTNWSEQEQSAFARLLIDEQIDLDWFNKGTVANLLANNKVCFYSDLIHFSQTFLSDTRCSATEDRASSLTSHLLEEQQGQDGEVHGA